MKALVSGAREKYHCQSVHMGSTQQSTAAHMTVHSSRGQAVSPTLREMLESTDGFCRQVGATGSFPLSRQHSQVQKSSAAERWAWHP